jgi:hypothetical protein
MEQTPGMLQAIVNMLRRGGGQGPQQTQGRAQSLSAQNQMGDVASRGLQIAAAEAGMTVPEYLAAQQQQQLQQPR